MNNSKINSEMDDPHKQAARLHLIASVIYLLAVTLKAIFTFYHLA